MAGAVYETVYILGKEYMKEYLEALSQGLVQVLMSLPTGCWVPKRPEPQQKEGTGSLAHRL